MTAIKICGLHTRQAVETATELGIDYIGFVFANSRRQVTPEFVRLITHGLQTPKRIGVFVDETIDRILRIAEMTELDGVQLHGAESPEFCQRLKQRIGKPVWKAWSVRDDESDLNLAGYQNSVDALLLDAFHPGQTGGTGQTFAWQVIPTVRQWLPHLPLIVAGGLSTANVVDLIESYQPDGVDVSSGVETNGQKDRDLMRDFVEAVRNR